MSLSPERIEAVGRAVAAWRMQEYIALPLYTLYIYFCLTSIAEEVSDIMRREGRTGKVLFVILRYGTIGYIALRLTTDYRTYFIISPMTCKALGAVTIVLLRLTALASDVTVGLCVSMLFELRRAYLLGLMFLCSAFPTIYFVVSFLAYIQVPADPSTALDIELGYPCYIPSNEALQAHLPWHSLAIYSYLNYARALGESP
ncbi:hypothetical protein FA13DRAFT_1092136 [Coprinellus micaceus]|uniref:Uncharacterized protein n=1 Tax=Coprinellus micaceus TaxID=71717 RepID=A0A4Y7TS43_COPMI|nr:hypothetical protein FA13DRAFT_1092136 [Coprinellus micaceus]